MNPELNKIYCGDTLEKMRQWPDAFVQTVVTSPPYWGLRDYGVVGQLGLEKSPDAYVQKMVEVFQEVRRVLKDDGTLWLNLGDSYASDTKGSGGPSLKQDSNGGSRYESRKLDHGLKTKDLVGIPWRVAFALQADGWYLRSDIIWAKPNPMPESVTDRPTKAHEYLFLMTKSERYYYDAEAIKEQGISDRPDMAENSIRTGLAYLQQGPVANNHWRGKYKDAKTYDGKKSDKQRGHGRRHAGFNDRWDQMSKEDQCSGMRNKRSVWTVATSPYAEAHFATFPSDLIKPCILAGSKEQDIVFDPFMGAGTTALVALEYNRQFIGTELNPDYVALAENRIANELAQQKLAF